ncbi:MAG: CCA tRNA nucleotidyltransferase [Rhizobiaceae bacterium]|nr:CCA tRNA nucleotidyltransferase [Rhizobiaceae bacterium]MCV0407799.1 CCA tRNA nucleotidyltransferase [Rhizobiaceae bacterium]
MGPVSIGSADWLKDESLQRLLTVLSQDGEEARVAGGAVRNELLGEAVTDIDIATTTTPEQTTKRAEAAGFKVVPTGFEHGTVTVVSDGRPFEATTLRADVETDGRRAVVAFGRDWRADAERRDFTINALYATVSGEVVDLVGGLPDLETRTIRFIGDAEARIREDYLRILRFFRFFAWYGSGRPDPEGLKACARLKEGISRLSAERIWLETKKLLAAPNPSRALLWMRQAGVLTTVLPETEKWGIDAIHGLVRAEADLGWPADPLLRLEAIIPPDETRVMGLADRLKLSKAETARLAGWAATPLPPPGTTEMELGKLLYRGDPGGFRDQLKIAQAGARVRAVEDDRALVEAGGWSRLLNCLEQWKKPRFPIRGGDLAAIGIAEGPTVGAMLRELENEWIASGFAMGREALLERAAARSRQ